jgi:outer membrane protein OmpA-like peptidoglycan-associated protein
MGLAMSWPPGRVLIADDDVEVASRAAAEAEVAATSTEVDAPSVGRLLDATRQNLKSAKDLGAKKHLPTSYEEIEDGLTEAEELLAAGKGTPESLARVAGELHVKSQRLVVQARFVKDMREQKHSWEITLRRFDQAITEMALTTGLTVPATLSGPAAAEALLDSLSRWKLHQRLYADSLKVTNRQLERKFRTMSAEQESTVTALQVEISSLRRQLWDTELRAGMAEAERSAAQTDLEWRQERELAIREITGDFGPDEAEVLLTPEGDVIIRVFGFSFAVGSVVLQGGQDELVDKLVAAVAQFPGARLRVEGHTDNTGGRDVNMRLSRRRAETVANLLQERLDLAAEDLEIVGHGPDRPLATNSTDEGRARNRRIDVVILPGGP